MLIINFDFNPFKINQYRLKFLRLNFATSLTSAFISFLDSFHALEGLMLDIINDKVRIFQSFTDINIYK